MCIIVVFGYSKYNNYNSLTSSTALSNKTIPPNCQSFNPSVRFLGSSSNRRLRSATARWRQVGAACGGLQQHSSSSFLAESQRFEHPLRVSNVSTVHPRAQKSWSKTNAAARLARRAMRDLQYAIFAAFCPHSVRPTGSQCEGVCTHRRTAALLAGCVCSPGTYSHTIAEIGFGFHSEQ